MNIILDRTPKVVGIGGKAYPIRWDFRTSILFELMVQDDGMSDKEKVFEALRLYYPEIPPDLDLAVEKLLWFYRCGRKEKAKAEGSEKTENNEPKKLIYSYEHDADYIYGAFMQQYGIDLSSVENLHWWNFRALFISLNDSCEFVKIMGYRAMEITGKMTAEQRKYYRRMKEVYALPVSEAEQERQDAITQVLLHGGDLAGLL